MVITYINGLEQRRLARLNAEEVTLRLARVITSYQQSLMEGARQLTSAMALVNWHPQTDAQGCSDHLVELNERFPVYSSISVASPNGTILCSSVPVDPSLTLFEQGYFQRALQSGEFEVGRAKVGLLTQHTIVPVAFSVRDEAGAVSYLLVAGIDLQSVVDLTETINLPPDSVLLMVGSDSTVMVRYPSGEEWAGLTLPDEEVVQSILRYPGEGQVEVFGLDGVTRLYAFTPVQISEDYRLMASIGIPTDIVYAAADRAIRSNFLWISIIALLALAVAWFIGDALILRVVSLTAERDAAEEQLRSANISLEHRVAERTEALDKANTNLNIELEERKRALHQLHLREVELEKMLAMLEKSNRELENFAYITSHDLQEPLRKIQAFGDRLTKVYAEELGDEGADFIQRMRSAASRMQIMINDLLSYSRVTTRASSFVDVDLNRVASEVIEDLEIRISDSNAQVIVDPLPVIVGDPSQMRQLMQNLITNAIKFHRKGVDPLVKISCQKQMIHLNGSDVEEVLIIVEDNGIGFDEKYAERIFQPFQRLHSRDVFEGSGIGLAICRKIAERHSGSITAHSTPGKGSRFIITLPRYPTHAIGGSHDPQ